MRARYTLKRFKVKSGLSKLAVTFIEFMAPNFELSTGSALEISQNRDTARHSDGVRFFFETSYTTTWLPMVA